MSYVNQDKLRNMLEDRLKRMSSELEYMRGVFSDDPEFTELLERMERDLEELNRLLLRKL